MPRDVLKLSERGLGWARLGKCSNSPFQHSKKCLISSVSLFSLSISHSLFLAREREKERERKRESERERERKRERERERERGERERERERERGGEHWVGTGYGAFRESAFVPPPPAAGACARNSPTGVPRS